MDTKGIKAILTAAEAGETIAQCVAAGHYYHGKNVPKDLDKAERLWRLAAEKGNAAAQYCLGFNCYNKIGIEESVKWIEKAADNGFPQAQNYLGLMLFLGFGVLKRDRVFALKWMKLGAEQSSHLMPKLYYAFAKLVTNNARILEAENLVEQWRRLHLPSTTQSIH